MVLIHEEAKGLEGRGSGQLILALLEVFDQQREQVGQFLFGARQGGMPPVKILEKACEVLVFRPGTDDPGRVLARSFLPLSFVVLRMGQNVSNENAA